MRLGLSLALTLLLAFLFVPFMPRRANAGERSGVQELGIATGFGSADRDGVKIVPLFFRAGWYFPDFIDAPLARHGLNLKWVVEPWFAGITNHSDAFEFGVNLLYFKLDYDRGQTVVPFVAGGEGAMYTSLQGLHLGGPFEFSSAIGAGLHVFLTKQVALSLSYRLRHISNAGLRNENSGLNTDFFLVGLEEFPQR